MKIHYSPYFDRKTYVASDLLGECLLETAGLLDRLELICGLTQKDVDDEERQREYLKALLTLPDRGQMKESIDLDRMEAESHEKPQLKVTTELLKWRDALIMAGWDRVKPLQGARIGLLSQAEALLPKQGCVRRGSADRWLALEDKTALLRKTDLQIVVHCPKVLIPPRVAKMITLLCGEEAFVCEYDRPEPMRLDGRQVLKVEEPYQAYEWLAMQAPQAQRLVVCGDVAQLDQVLRSMAQPTAGEDPEVMCHWVVNDVRCQLDSPKQLIWIDCAGGYGLNYAYGFLSADESAQFTALPTEGEMLEAIHNHMIALLNRVDKVTLVATAKNLGQPQNEHPMVAAMIHGAAEKITPQELTVTMPTEQEPHKEIRFVRQMSYQLEGGIQQGEGKAMSYSTLENLIDYPFNYVMERVAGLKEPPQPEALPIVKGNVAHRVIEHMIKDHQGIDMGLFDELFSISLDEKGQELTKEENRFELDEFKVTLRESLEVLDQIIKEQHLTPIESEFGIGTEEPVALDTFGMSKAYIDLVLRREGEEEGYFIFDFKYSLKVDDYREKLAYNQSLQFAFYQEIFDRHSHLGRVKALGYYLIPLKTLYVPEGELGSAHLFGKHIDTVTRDEMATDDLLASMKKSYSRRMEELQSGAIEEAEGMPLADLPYQQRIADKEALIPVAQDKNGKLKKNPFAPTHIVMKNQIR